MISEWYSSNETQALLKEYRVEKATLDVLGFKNIGKLVAELDDPFSMKDKSLAGYIELFRTKKTDTKVSKKDLEEIDTCPSGIIAFAEGESKKAFYSRLESYIKIKNPLRKKYRYWMFKNIDFYLCPADQKIFMVPNVDTKVPLESLMDWIDEEKDCEWFKEEGFETIWVEGLCVNSTSVLCNVLNQFYEDNQTPFEIVAMFYDLDELPYYRPFRQVDMNNFLSIEGKIYLEPEATILPTNVEEIINEFTKTFTNLKFYFKTWETSHKDEWARCIYIMDSKVKLKVEAEKNV